MDDDGKFVEFVASRWYRLFRVAYLLAGSETAAEDLLQTTLEKVYVRWSRVSRMEAPDAYVRKVLVTTSISSTRRMAWRREPPSDAPPEQQVEFPEGRLLDHVLLWPLVCALPERQRAAVVLRYYEDLTEAETAEVLGCSVGTVKSQTHDGVRALRRGIESGSAGEVVAES